MNNADGAQTNLLRLIPPPRAEEPKLVHPEAGAFWSKSRIMPRHKMQKCDWSRHPEWTQKTQRLIASFQARPDLMAALIGPRGTGKTQAAVEVIRAACRDGKRAMYSTAMEFFARVKATFSAEESVTESSVINDYAKPALLVIDEVQVRSDSAWENNLLTHLVDRRYGHMLATVFIGNLSTDDFRISVGDSIYSRLAQTGGLIVFDGPSWRESPTTESQRAERASDLSRSE
jgi:DNA replication protein DnaC